MTKQEFENNVKLALYEYFKDSRTKEYINEELEKEKEWLNSYYEDSQKEDYAYDDEYIIRCAVENFSMWL